MPQGGFEPGPKHLSLLEFETWRLRSLGHHGRLQSGFSHPKKWATSVVYCLRYFAKQLFQKFAES